MCNIDPVIDQVSFNSIIAMLKIEFVDLIQQKDYDIINQIQLTQYRTFLLLELGSWADISYSMVVYNFDFD